MRVAPGYFAALLFLVGLGPTDAATTRPAASQPSAVEIGAFNVGLERIDAGPMPFKQREALAEEIQTQWADKDPSLYGYLMMELSHRFSDTGVDVQQPELSRKYAVLALQKFDQMSLNMQANVVETFPRASPDQPDWVLDRPVEAKRWLALLQRLKDAEDPK